MTLVNEYVEKNYQAKLYKFVVRYLKNNRLQSYYYERRLASETIMR